MQSLQPRLSMSRVMAVVIALVMAVLALTAANSAKASASTADGTTPTGEPAQADSRPADPVFSFAVLPDTQQEVLQADDDRFLQRTQWLASERKRLDLRFVLHSGDVTNWGWLTPSQYTVASAAMKPLEEAKIPYALSIGNHDTRAVGWNGAGGYGGDAYVKNPECLQRFSPAECDTKKLVRHTEEWNAVFPPSRISALGGTFEAGKSDNMFTTYQAGGKKWLVLTLELWPRPEAVAWARQVVEAHPDSNVIVQTHSYLTASGSIEPTNGGYGSTSGQYLYDNLIKLYPNIKLVFSGHVGTAAHRTDVGVHGNVIHSFLECFHSNTTNPVRLVEINTRRNTLETRIYGPSTDESFPEFSVSLSGLNLV
ncbi:metallophosphoesterase [Actinopolymorpha pittospori]|uniref:Calcineurin-like phosphoesterase domain-containing protein n=1 Tax=Actinopolymorpha pittospori TaxID=648752 RepID=A0A927RFA6_9ACTN|nr:metallophosphoesterase [Actinopolymorpha pittospori]MBE1613144.1 hypothetical protein [Actinopolymorpha pittospori]